MLGAPSPPTRSQIDEVLASCELRRDPRLLSRVETYLGSLAKWNTRMNLTSIREPVDVMKVLLAESFFAATLVNQPEGPILDVGSGAGFPGLAMAVYRPELELILLEPRKKRAAFLSALRRQLGLAQVEVWNRRIEECAVCDFSERPAVLTMRAVGGIKEVLKESASLLQGSGEIVLFSSVQAAKGTMAELEGVHWRAPSPIPWHPEHVVLLGHLR